MRPLLVVLLLVVASATVRAADQWTYGASEHFEVFTTANASRAREALRHFEGVHAFLASFILNRPLPTPTRTRLIIFSNERQFAPYRPSESAEAFYLPGLDRDYIVMSRFDPTATQIVVHEYVHLILKHTGGRYPIWLNEGLAEFFSTMMPESGRMMIGGVPLGRYQALLGGTLMPVARMLDVNHDSPEYNSRTHSGLFYAQSWALTHMIFAEDTYKPKSDAFIGLIANGASSAAAFLQVYGKTPEVVERDLRNYLSTTMRVFRPAYEGPPAPTAYETRAVSSFDADLVTANLLANTVRGEAAARESFARLEQQKADDLAMLESRAYFELRHGQRETAVRYFERAVEKGSQNLAVFRDYIALNPAAAETVVPKALALAPDDVDIGIESASLLVRQRKYADALALLTRMKDRSRPQNFRAYQLLANIHLQMNQPEEARRAAAKLVELADGRRESAFAAELQATVERYAAERAALDARVRAAAAAAEVDARIAAVQAGEAEAKAAAAPPPSTPILTPAETIVTASGRIRNVTSCTSRPVMEVVTNGRTVRLSLDDPRKVSVRGRSTSTLDLTCGLQDTPITIGYVAAVDKQRNTSGSVRVLDYGK
jgi:tetratricopeptide (TPR) repeat protein